jgi:ABC-type phosphate/phosphonate transport system ATPase subunit
LDKACKNLHQVDLADKYRTLVVGMAEKAKEFTEKGSEIYHGNVPDGAKDQH